MLLTPRSSNYERLEGGLGPSRMSTRRFGWKKFAIGAVVLIGLVYIVGPRKHNLIPNKYIPCESIRFLLAHECSQRLFSRFLDVE